MRIALVISLLALIAAPVLLIRFRTRWVAAFNRAVTNRITSPFAGRLPGFGIVTHVVQKIRAHISHAGECIQSSEQISDRPHLRT
jgi:hypothetical protein